jgi:hypothetical protein
MAAFKSTVALVATPPPKHGLIPQIFIAHIFILI